MNANGIRTDWWKTTAVTLAAILVSVGGSWFAFGRDTVSRSQVADIVNTTSPFAVERSGITQHFATIDAQIAALQIAFHQHTEDDSHMQARLATIAEQLRELRAGR